MRRVYAHRYATLGLGVGMPVFAVAGLGMALAFELGVFLIGLGARW